MDDFIKEKLDIWNDTANTDIDVPNSSACKRKIEMQLEAKRTEEKKRKRRILAFSTGGFATAAIAFIIILFTVILTPAFVYRDADLIAYQISIDELRADYGVFAINDMYEGFNCQEAYIYKHKDTGVSVHTKLVYEKDGNTLELRIILVDNYEFAAQTSYNNLTQEYIDERFTGKFDFKDNVLYAKLNCDKKQYFLQFMHSNDGINEDIITLDTILALLQ